MRFPCKYQQAVVQDFVHPQYCTDFVHPQYVTSGWFKYHPILFPVPLKDPSWSAGFWLPRLEGALGYTDGMSYFRGSLKPIGKPQFAGPNLKDSLIWQGVLEWWLEVVCLCGGKRGEPPERGSAAAGRTFCRGGGEVGRHRWACLPWPPDHRSAAAGRTPAEEVGRSVGIAGPSSRGLHITEALQWGGPPAEGAGSVGMAGPSSRGFRSQTLGVS